MDMSDLKEKRQAAIIMLRESLDSVEVSGAPFWCVSLLLFVAFLGLVLWQGVQLLWVLLRGTVATLFELVIAPFAVLWIFVEIVLLIVWYLSQVAEKMSGGKK